MNSGVKKKRTATSSAKPKSAKPSKAGKQAKSGSKPLSEAAPKPRESGARWTFLTNHSHVLIVLHAEPDLVLREVAARVGITERAVQRVVLDLEEGGFIRRERVGRKNHYEVVTDVPLRHPIESHRNIGDLLKLITG